MLKLGRTLIGVLIAGMALVGCQSGLPTVGDFDTKHFPIPDLLLDNLQRALRDGETNYPPSNGLASLRQAVTEFTARSWGARYPVESVLIASGARPILYGAYRALSAGSLPQARKCFLP